MSSEYSQVVFNLFAVLALMVALLYMVKKFKLAKYAGNSHIKIINNVAIGHKERVILMEVNNTFLLVGATPNHIETLYVFNEVENAVAATKEFAVEN